GETVDIPAREIEIGRLDIVEHGVDRTVFEVECGKGTYVRSLARDMGRDLGCFGHISELRRVEVEPFTADDFVTVAATKIRLGNPVIIRGRDAPVEAEEACATARGKLVAIGAIEQGMFKPKRVFAG
ncbi:MAG: tRNA pseudouridine(55) synthase TruB, partial [Mesorhizobium sp.]